jgi:threonyl-tRNA synthetase
VNVKLFPRRGADKRKPNGGLTGRRTANTIFGRFGGNSKKHYGIHAGDQPGDFVAPARFGLSYHDRDNTDKTRLCIHHAPLGTHERFIGFLIEHYAGNFPLWLAPEQVRVMTIGEEEPLVNYAKAIVNELRANFVRVEVDFSSNKINGKIQEAKKAKVHTMLVIGARDLEAGNVSVRVHGKGNLGARPKGEVI